MKDFFLLTFYILLFGWAGTVTAAEKQAVFIDPPYFLTDAIPDVVECSKQQLIQRGVMPQSIQCVIESAPRSSDVLVGYSDGSDQWITSVANAEWVTCGPRYCKTQRGEPAGQLNGLIQGQLQVFTMAGYYLAVDHGVIRAHRRGTGPMAEQYPRYYVQRWDGQAQQASTQKTYDLWCNPRGEYCTFTLDGTEYRTTREELPLYIPMADGGDCMIEVCYNDNGDVIGLNPNHSSYH